MIVPSTELDVRTRPHPSASVHRGEEIREEDRTPPDPPLMVGGVAIDPVPLAVRRFRVEVQGSKRKRDLAAVHIAGELGRLEELGEITLTGESMLAWVNAVFRLRVSVPDSTFNLWLRPLQVLGAQGDTLFLFAPDDKRSWIERRYSALIVEALEAAGGLYRRVSFAGVRS